MLIGVSGFATRADSAAPGGPFSGSHPAVWRPASIGTPSRHDFSDASSRAVVHLAPWHGALWTGSEQDKVLADKNLSIPRF